MSKHDDGRQLQYVVDSARSGDRLPPFDGYHYWGSFERCASVANAVSRRYQEYGTLPSSLVELQTARFFEQRADRQSMTGYSALDSPYYAALQAAIHAKLVLQDKRQSTAAGALDDMYGPPSISAEAFEAAALRSLNPRGPEMLYDALETYGLTEGDRVLDAGCRDAAHDVVIARRFGCSVLGIDPVMANITNARDRISREAMDAQIQVVLGRMEAIPAASDSVAFIWCRDVLSHVPDLRVAFAECARVLRPGGRMLIYATFATDLLELGEAGRLYGPLAIAPDSMSPAVTERAWEVAGLRMLLRDEIGSEWREGWEESGRHTTAVQLLKIAHLRRDRERLIEELGPIDYAIELGDCHWGVYQMLGKLCPTLIVLEKPAA